MKTTVLADFSRFFLSAVFLLAAGAKLYMLNKPMESSFTNMILLFGHFWGLPLAIAVITAELAVGGLLLLKRFTRPAAAGATVLLMGFASYALYYRFGLHHRFGLDCGCFGGIIKSQLGVRTALRNLCLLVPAVLILTVSQKDPALRPPIRTRAQKEIQNLQTASDKRLAATGIGIMKYLILISASCLTLAAIASIATTHFSMAPAKTISSEHTPLISTLPIHKAANAVSVDQSEICANFARGGLIEPELRFSQYC
jgi:uncharacterized membrane protein YphA (DoxX/SURF4 family)